MGKRRLIWIAIAALLVGGSAKRGPDCTAIAAASELETLSRTIRTRPGQRPTPEELAQLDALVDAATRPRSFLRPGPVRDAIDTVQVHVALHRRHLRPIRDGQREGLDMPSTPVAGVEAAIATLRDHAACASDTRFESGRHRSSKAPTASAGSHGRAIAYIAFGFVAFGAASACGYAVFGSQRRTRRSPEERQPVRKVYRDVLIQTAAGSRAAALIDITTRGAKVADPTLRPGMPVEIEILGSWQPALVRWSRKELAGVEFVAPLSKTMIATLAVRTNPDLIPAPRH